MGYNGHEEQHICEKCCKSVHNVFKILYNAPDKKLIMDKLTKLLYELAEVEAI